MLSLDLEEALLAQNLMDTLGQVSSPSPVCNRTLLGKERPLPLVVLLLADASKPKGS